MRTDKVAANPIEAFTRVYQNITDGTQLDVQKNVKIATVEATLLIEDRSAFSTEPFSEMKTMPVTVVADLYSGSTANFRTAGQSQGLPTRAVELGMRLRRQGMFAPTSLPAPVVMLLMVNRCLKFNLGTGDGYCGPDRTCNPD